MKFWVSRLKMAEEKQKIQVMLGGEKEKDVTCVTFIIREEDHTLGNALNHVVSQYPEVEFCAYNIPHPLEDEMMFRIQTKPGHSALSCFVRGLDELHYLYGEVSKKFQQALPS